MYELALEPFSNCGLKITLFNVVPFPINIDILKEFEVLTNCDRFIPLPSSLKVPLPLALKPYSCTQ